MSLNLSVRRQLTRSVNIERDRESLQFADYYVPTSRALRTVEQLTGVIRDGSRDRAWSLVGPYGSGKSSFALFLSHLLNHDEQLRQPSAQLLHRAAPDLAASFESQRLRFLVVSVVGSPEALGLKLLRALLLEAESFFNARRGRNPRVLLEIEELIDSKTVSHSEVMLLLRQLNQDLQKAGLNGMLIIVDELGKFLEYEVRHYGANDIFLLQSIAEECGKQSEFNLLCTVLLHQSMERYAKGLSDTLRNEWGKVQGRFEEVPF